MHFFISIVMVSSFYDSFFYVIAMDKRGGWSLCDNFSVLYFYSQIIFGFVSTFLNFVEKGN